MALPAPMACIVRSKDVETRYLSARLLRNGARDIAPSQPLQRGLTSGTSHLSHVKIRRQSEHGG